MIAKSYDLFTFPYAGLGTTNRKLAEKLAEVKRVLKALIEGKPLSCGKTGTKRSRC